MLFYKCDACRVDVSNEDVCCVNLHKGFSNVSKQLCPSCYDTIRKFMSAWDTPEKEDNVVKTVTTSSDFFVKEKEDDTKKTADDSIAIWVKETKEPAPVKEVEQKTKKRKDSNSVLSAEDKDAILKMYKSGETSATKITKALNLPYHAVYYYINKLKLYNVRVQEKSAEAPRIPKSKPPMVLPPKQTAKPQRNVSDEERQKIYANIAMQMNVLASNVGTVHSLSKAGWSPKSIAYDCLGGKIELVKDILFELHEAGI